MLGRVLLDNPIYTSIRVEYGRDYTGAPRAGVQYDFAILYHYEDPANIGFAGGHVIWEDDVVRVYQRGTGRSSCSVGVARCDQTPIGVVTSRPIDPP